MPPPGTPPSGSTQPGSAQPGAPQTVVEFGNDPDEAHPGRRRWSTSGFAMGLAADRRSVPLAAVVAAVALFASLISEWQVTALDGQQFIGRQTGTRPLTVGVADLGALGAGYLVGVFVLAAVLVLVLFGPSTGRTSARLVGLSAGGVLLGLLAALTAQLGGSTRAVDAIFLLDVDPEQIHLSYGRGIWCAFFGVLVAILALHLAGRHIPVVPAAGPGDAEADGPAEQPDAPVVWSWRRPHDRDEDQQPDVPFDLTVTSTSPFTSLSDDRDKPADRDRPHGISG